MLTRQSMLQRTGSFRIQIIPPAVSGSRRLPGACIARIESREIPMTGRRTLRGGPLGVSWAPGIAGTIADKATSQQFRFDRSPVDDTETASRGCFGDRKSSRSTNSSPYGYHIPFWACRASVPHAYLHPVTSGSCTACSQPRNTLRR
jgi:hypothetical protein